MAENQSLKIVVTGASSGIGRALAYHLASLGHDVFLGARRKDALDDVCQKAKGLKGRLFSHHLDVSDEKSVKDFFVWLRSQSSGLDVLINNAGIGLVESIEKSDLAHSKTLFDVNFFGPLLCSREAIPLLKQNSGQIIMISSVNAFRGTPKKGVYSASKFALRGLSDSMRVELAPYGIKVININPGFVLTDFHIGDVEAKITQENTVEQVVYAVVTSFKKKSPHVYVTLRGLIYSMLSEFFPQAMDKMMSKRHYKKFPIKGASNC